MLNIELTEFIRFFSVIVSINQIYVNFFSLAQSLIIPTCQVLVLWDCWLDLQWEDSDMTLKHDTEWTFDLVHYISDEYKRHTLIVSI